ncbi:hypothetical protein [Sphingobium phenoxybenzoativorans]|uniref:hypothetical protein n=1 Tax=Sphingobium phenoxybenzoativorans TaxID=1592790 RepID=UPI001112D626|nr:hypothetical protein [Sphingobium phenoxybenzoativorans]
MVEARSILDAVKSGKSSWNEASPEERGQAGPWPQNLTSSRLKQLQVLQGNKDVTAIPSPVWPLPPAIFDWRQ